MYDIKETKDEISLSINEDILENNLSDSLSEDNKIEDKNQSVIDEIYETKSNKLIDNIMNDDANINYGDLNYITSINEKVTDNMI